MITKAELMTFMKKYKKENCKSISTMSKDELYKEAVAKGFLHEKHGIKKKTKTPAAPAPAPAPAPSPKASGKVTKEQIDKLEKEIESLRQTAGKIAEKAGRSTAKTDQMVKKVASLTKERIAMSREYKKQQKAS